MIKHLTLRKGQVFFWLPASHFLKITATAPMIITLRSLGAEFRWWCDGRLAVPVLWRPGGGAGSAPRFRDGLANSLQRYIHLAGRSDGDPDTSVAARVRR